MNYAGEPDTPGTAAPSTEDKTFGYCWLTDFQPWERFSDLDCLGFWAAITNSYNFKQQSFLLKFGEFGFMMSMVLKGDHDKNILKLCLSSENNQ